MKHLIKSFSLTAALLLSGALALHAQQRFGNNRGNYNNGNSTTTYNNNGTVGSAMISMDPDTHSIVIAADKETMEQISNVIRNLDMPKPQVLIKVVFMEVDHNNALDLGVEGGWGQQNGSIQQTAGDILGLSGLNSAITNLGALGQPIKQGALTASGTSASALLGSGGLYQIAGSDFQATLRAIAQAGKAQILSRPSILARDGQLAQIVIGQQIYLPSGVAFESTGNNASVPIIEGQYQNVGIILDVTPYIGKNNLVEMILQPQTTSIDTSSQGQLIAAASGTFGNTSIFAPNLNVRIADTVVVTPDAQPVVIGGLIGDDKTTVDTKVPFLGDIPLLGNLFKHTSKSTTKNELLIFLTPHIVREPAQLAPMSANETAQTPGITNSISEQELERYLEHIPVKQSGK